MAKKTFRSWDVDQSMLLPPSVKEFVPDDHPAHFVRDLVRDELDLSAIYADYPEERGQPPFHPAMMTALLIYAYTQGVYSSRRIARGCEERMDFIAVAAMEKPDFRTVAKFRQRHLKALGELFVQVLRLCRKAGLAKLGHVALDSTKMKANASKHKAMSFGRMKESADRLEREVASWFKRAGAEDATEDEAHGDRRGDELPDWVKSKQRRLEKIKEAKAALEAEATEPDDDDDPPRGPRRPEPGQPNDKAQRNFTDPESKIMKTKDGFEQSYSASIAVDAQSHVIVGRLLTNQQSDQASLQPLLDDIRASLRSTPSEVSADAGYCSEANFAALDRRRIRGFVSTGRKRHSTSQTTRGLRPPRPGSRMAAMDQRLKRGGWNSRYRLRKCTVEPVFGQIKQARGFRQFLMRGVTKTSGEWDLICIAHNLTKLYAARR
jgi:transposase